MVFNLACVRTRIKSSAQLGKKIFWLFNIISLRNILWGLNVQQFTKKMSYL